MPEKVFDMTINQNVFEIPCTVEDFLNLGWVLASIPYHAPTYDESFYEENAYYSCHELGDTIGPGVLNAVLWYEDNYKQDVQLIIVNPTTEEIPIEKGIVSGIKTLAQNDIFMNKVVEEWSLDMFHDLFSDGWERSTEKTYDDIGVVKYSVYRTVNGLTQRCAFYTDYFGKYVSAEVEIPVQ